MVLTADLQGRENGGKNRLLGESVAETLSALSEQCIIPPLGVNTGLKALLFAEYPHSQIFPQIENP